MSDAKRSLVDIERADGRSAFEFGVRVYDGAGVLPAALIPAPEPNQVLINRTDLLMFIPLAPGGPYFSHALEGSIVSALFTEHDFSQAFTTSATFINRLSMSENFPVGLYMVVVSYGWKYDSIGDDFESRVTLDAAQQGQLHTEEPQDSSGVGFGGTNQTHYVTRNFILNLNGAHVIELDWRSVGGSQATITDSSIVAINLTEIAAL